MRRAMVIAVLLCLIAVLVVHADVGQLTITFIGNEAFRITDGETTLLSDFPYVSGAFGYMEYDMAAAPEIKDGLALITHFHADHWKRELFLETALSIIGPPGITERLPNDRVIPLTEDRPMRFKGIEVQAIKTPHQLAPQHYSYLVTWRGLRLYFVGDTETPADILQQKDIDVMFITPWLIRTIERQNLSLDAKTLIVYHHKIGEEIPPFQDYTILDQGETMTIAPDDSAEP